MPNLREPDASPRRRARRVASIVGRRHAGLTRAAAVVLGTLLAMTVSPVTDAAGGSFTAVTMTAATGPRTVDDSCPDGVFPEDGFVDVPADNVHERMVDCLVWWQVANGRNSAYYAPASGVSREAMASFIARALGIDLSQPVPDAFTDDDRSVHQSAINHLASLGVVGGTGEGHYSPTRTVSRAQMARFMVRAAEQALDALIVADADHFDDDAGHLFELDIDKAASVGVVGGRGARTYAPDAPVSRDAMASFLTRLLDLTVEGGVRQQPDPLSVPRNPEDDLNCEDFASRGDAQARYAHYAPHYGDNARLDPDGDQQACDGPTACPEQFDGQVSEETAARCLYEAWVASETALAAPYASQAAVDWFDPFRYDGQPWDWEGCDAAMMQDGARSCFWYIPDPDPAFHGVLIEMLLGRDANGHFISAMESYG